jgi:hypothetical protein
VTCGVVGSIELSLCRGAPVTGEFLLQNYQPKRGVDQVSTRQVTLRFNSGALFLIVKACSSCASADKKGCAGVERALLGE